MKTLRSCPRAWLAGVALCAAGAVVAHEVAHEGAPDAAPQTPATAEARKAVRDAATGRLRAPEHGERTQAPSAAAEARRAQALQRISAMRTLAGPRGASGVKLDASQLSFTVARRAADGSIAVDCVTGDDAAATAMAGTHVEGGKHAQ